MASSINAAKSVNDIFPIFLPFKISEGVELTLSAFVVSWPASVEWPAATAPTLTSTSNAVDVLVFQTVDGGTTWYGFVAGQGLA